MAASPGLDLDRFPTERTWLGISLNRRTQEWLGKSDEGRLYAGKRKVAQTRRTSDDRACGERPVAPAAMRTERAVEFHECARFKFGLTGQSVR
jgi:hypothetical protein